MKAQNLSLDYPLNKIELMPQDIHIKTLLQNTLIALILIGLCITSCQQNQNLSDQNDPTAYKAPVTKPYRLTEPKSIDWEIIDPDSIPPPTSATLDIDKLPAKPFSINEFKPLKTPMKEYPLDWDNLPITPLQFDTVDIKPKASIIQKPIITKMNKPSIREGTTAGILQLAQTEGFPSSEIASIIENEDGTFWITFDDLGICLYNGEYLYTYKYEDIFNLVKDHEGRLWYSREDGFYILDFKNNIQWHFPLSTGPRDLYCDHRGTIWISARDNVYTLKSDLKHLRKTANKDFNRATAFMEDRNHNFWIGFGHHDAHGSDRQIFILDKERKGFKRIKENEQWHIGVPGAFFEDQNGYVWIGNVTDEQNGAVSISPGVNKVRVLGKENGFSGHSRLVQEDIKGRIWLMQNGSFSILSEDQSQIKTIPVKGNIFFNSNIWFDATIRDRQGNIWVSTRNSGVILIGRDGAIGEQLDESNGLLSGEVWGIDEDNRGEIWLATGAGGVNIYDPKKKVLRSIDRTILRNSPGRNISTLKEFDTDKYFVEGQIGFSIIDRLKNKIFHYDTDRFYGSIFQDVLMDDSDNLWLPNNRGLMVYNTKFNHVKIIKENTPQFPGTRALDIIDDGAGHYWIATQGAGLVIINPKDNTLQNLTEKEGLCSNHVVRILPRENGELWIATIDGLSIINTENQTITNVGEEQGMVPDELYEMREKEGIIYLGSVNGLIQMQPKPGKNKDWHFYNLSTAQGFLANDYNRGGSHVMKNGQLWMGAGNPFKLNILTQEPSIDTMHCPVSIIGLKISDENISFESKADLNTFFETNDTLWYDGDKQFYLEQTLPQDSGYLFTNNIRWDSLSLPYNMPVGLKLTYDQNSLQFRFSNQCVFNRDKISNRYILEGKDDTWVYNKDASTSKTYFNLTSGSYTFKVATKGMTGQWGETAEFNFRITPPWWRTWWAYLAYVLLLIGGVWSIVQYRSRRLKRENRLLEEKVVHRTTKLRESIDNLKATQAQLIHSEKMASLGELTAGIAHEIQNPLNFVNNFSEVNVELTKELEEEIEKGDLEEVKALSKDIRENEEKIMYHGKRAESIVKGMLQHSRSNSGEKLPTDINALADEYLRLAYHGFRAKDKSFNAKFETDFDESLEKIDVVPQEIGRVFLNLITNAFHAVRERSLQEVSENGYQPTVIVKTKKQLSPAGGGSGGGIVQIIVSDNGSGMSDEVKNKIFQPFFTTKPTGEGTGLGLSMSYDIVKAHGGKITVDTKEEKGTSFIITLPFV